MTTIEVAVRGKLKPKAPLAPLVWFKSGGAAELLFEPADRDDLIGFLTALDPVTPVMALGLGSNRTSAAPPDLNHTSGASGALGLSLPRTATSIDITSQP